MGYASGNYIEIFGVSKCTLLQENAEVTLATNDSKQTLLQNPISIDGAQLLVSLPPLSATLNATTHDVLSTTLVLKRLPIMYSQVQIPTAIHRLLTPQNVVSVTHNRAQNDHLRRREGAAMIRCLNSA